MPDRQDARSAASKIDPAGSSAGNGPGTKKAVCRQPGRPSDSAATASPEKLVRDVYTYLPHRVAQPGERYGLLAAKFDEEVAEVKAASIGSEEFIEELGDLIEVCYALGGEERVEAARQTKRLQRGAFDKLLVMRLEDRTDK